MAQLQSVGTQPRYAAQFGNLTNVKLSPPLAAYNVLMNELTNTGDLDSAVQLTGYEYPVLSAGQPVAEAIVAANSSRRGSAVRLSIGGSTPADLAKAFQLLPTLDQAHTGSYEARYLSGGGLFRAIWLKSAPGGSDYIYMLSPVSPLATGKLYPVADFVTTMIHNSQIQQAQGGFN